MRQVASNLRMRGNPFPFRGQHRSLVWELAKRDVFGRYRGASLGVIWSILNPFLMLAVYTVAFGEILKARWPGVENSTDFALVMFVGLIIHGFFAECIARAPGLVVGNANYVKRIVFPLEILPWPVVLSALFHLAMNFLVLAVALLIIKGKLFPAMFFLPIVLLPMIFIVLGALWLLSALGVYLRDISQLTAPLTTAMLFLSSAIVPVSSLSERYQKIFRLNPLTPVIDQARIVALHGGAPDWGLLAYCAVPAFVFAMISYGIYGYLRGGFADVL